MRHFASFLALLCLLLTAALFVLATVGVPVHDDWDLLHVNVAQEGRAADTIAQIGVLGICYQFDQNAAKNCTEPALGYSFPTLPGIQLENVDKYRALSVALVLNPLAAGLAGASALAWLVGWVLRVRVITIIALIPVVLAKFAAVIAFGVNLAIVLVLRSQIWELSNGAFSGHIGTLFWFSVAGCGTAVAAFLCAVQGTRSAKQKDVEGYGGSYTKSSSTY